MTTPRTKKPHLQAYSGAILLNIKKSPSLGPRTRTNTIKLQITPTDTVAHVKQKLSLIEGIPPDQQRLSYAGSVLQDGQVFGNFLLGGETVLLEVVKVNSKGQGSGGGGGGNGRPPQESSLLVYDLNSQTMNYIKPPAGHGVRSKDGVEGGVGGGVNSGSPSQAAFSPTSSQSQTNQRSPSLMPEIAEEVLKPPTPTLTTRIVTFLCSLRFLAPLVVALMVVSSCIIVSITTIIQLQQAIQALGSTLQGSIGDFSINLLNTTAMNQYRVADFIRNESYAVEVCFRSAPINFAEPDTYRELLHSLDQELRINPDLGILGCYTCNQVFSVQRHTDSPTGFVASILEVDGIYTHYMYDQKTCVIDNETVVARNVGYRPENRSPWRVLTANGGKPVALDFVISAQQRLGMYTYLPIFQPNSTNTTTLFDGLFLHVVFTDTITDFITSMRRTPNTIVFIVDYKESMAAASDPSLSLTIKVNGNMTTQIWANESENPVVKEVSRLFSDLLIKNKAVPTNLTTTSNTTPTLTQTTPDRDHNPPTLKLETTIRAANKLWVVQAKTLNQIPHALPNSYIASATPEEELYGPSAKIPGEATIISVCIIVVFAVLAMGLTVPPLRSLQQVVNQMKKLEKLDFSDFERGQFKDTSPISEIRAIQETLTGMTRTFVMALRNMNRRFGMRSTVTLKQQLGIGER
ncbi:hypothetical protein HK102_005378 [Quaeritorhiza haematococci]|nr:hypothetical protein HK102_005378 [Quaeritorhiza haematococci]